VFACDPKDGYWHADLHEDLWEYMCFEWEGQILFFAVMPFGLAPACWVFTKMMRVYVNHLRLQGLKVLAYIDDGLAAAQPLSEAERLRKLTLDTLIGCVLMINWIKSDLELSQTRKEFIGYRISTIGAGCLEPSEARNTKLMDAVQFAIQARTVSPRQLAKVTGHIVSLRPVLDPMAMMFTRHMNIWIQSVSDVFNWDWRTTLSPEAKEELKIWKGWFSQWNAAPIWKQGSPDLLMAQDASDVAVEGWLGVFRGTKGQTDHKGNNHWVGLVHFSEEVLEAAWRLERQDTTLSNTYRELYAVYFMIITFSKKLAGKWVRIQADNRSL
jgi:hypothetical protein